MGEAKRRKKLDLNYGKFTNLINLNHAKEVATNIVLDWYYVFNKYWIDSDNPQNVAEAFDLSKEKIQQNVSQEYKKFKPSDRLKISHLLMASVLAVRLEEEKSQVDHQQHGEMSKTILHSIRAYSYEPEWLYAYDAIDSRNLEQIKLAVTEFDLISNQTNFLKIDQEDFQAQISKLMP